MLRGILASSAPGAEASTKALGAPRAPKFVVTLLPRKLVKNVALTCLFLGAFTAAAYKGVVVQRIHVGGSDTAKTVAFVDDRVELYNTISGFLIALVETGLGVYMDNFLPAFQVYLHNALWYLHGNASATKWTNGLRATLMFIYPVFLMLVIGQSLRSFQASQSSVGYTRIMARADLAPDVSLTELLKLNASRSASTSSSAAGDNVGLGILQGAVNGTSLPFDLKHASPCDIQRAGIKVGLHDLDSVSVAYGFPPREWFSEMLDVSLNASYSAAYSQAAVEAGKAFATPDFDMDLAAEMFGHSKVLLDRAVAESMTEYEACEDSEDADEDDSIDRRSLDSLVEDAELFTGDEYSLAALRCDGSLRTLMEIGTFRALPPREQTPAALLNLISKSLAIAVDGLNRSSTRVEFRRHKVTEQIQMESMIVSAEIRIDNSTEDFFVDDDEANHNIYEFGENARGLCGEKNCVFVDPQNTLRIPHQIVLLPQQTGCSYTQEDILYRNDLRSFVPGNCSAVPHTGVAVAVSSYITADSYGSNVTRSFPSRTSGTPFLVNPRRVLRLTMSKLAWQPAPLDERFEVECRRQDGGNDCAGLAYRLTKTRRFVFASKDALPTAEIERATLMEPIQLVQLNKARFYIPKWGRVMPERLYWQSGLIKKHDWKTVLEGDQCSLFMDSYMRHVTNNGYVMDRPFQQLARATLFYLFAGGSVTELNQTTIAINATSAGKSSAGALDDALLEAQALADVKLKGDTQYRRIRVAVPRSTYAATLLGCGMLFMAAVLIVISPNTRGMEYFPPGTTAAAQYIAVKNDETYPTPVNKKTLLFPGTGESLPLDDFDVHALTLSHKANPTDEVRF